MKLQLQKVKIRQSDGSYKYLAGMKGEKGDPGDPYDATEIQKEIDDANRSLTALWELNEGKTYRFETDSEKAYSKTVPTGAKVASLEKLGGESIVWNQLYTQGLIQQNGWTVPAAPESLKEFSNEMITCKWIDDFRTYEIYQCSQTSLKIDQHIYLTSADIYADHDLSGRWTLQNSASPVVNFNIYGGRWGRYGEIKRYIKNLPLILAGIRLTPTEPTEVKFKNPIMIDLTQIFGSGNEPTTTDDPRILALEAYAEAHPDYTEGEIIDAVVNDIEVVGKNLAKWEKGNISSTDGLDMPWNINNAALRSQYVMVEPNKEYIFYANYDIQRFAAFYDLNFDYISRSNATFQRSLVFTTPANAKFVRVVMYKTSTYPDVLPSEIPDLQAQLEKGSIATEYSPYTETHIPLTLPTLRSINDSVYDEVDFERGVVIRRVGIVVVDDINIKIENTITVTDNLQRLVIPYASDTNIFKERSIYKNAKFIYTSNANKKEWCVSNTIGVGLNRLWFYFPLDYFSSITEAHEWFKSNPQIVYYELATPIEEPLTQTVEPFDVEPGGTITFKQEASEFSVNNTVEYIVKLSEV